MANIEHIKTDLGLETNGKWVNYALGIRLKIARSRNPRYREEMRRLTDPVREEARDDKLSIDDYADILLQVRARTILLDWENIEDADGKLIPYSVEQAEKFFRDEELKDFYQFVIAVSENADQYLKHVLEESEKN